MQRCLTDEFESYNRFSVTWKDMLEYLEFSKEDTQHSERSVNGDLVIK
jgi:hypothetical protein